MVASIFTFSVIHSLLTRRVDFLLPARNFNFLKVQCLDQGEELVFGLLEFVVDEAICEEHRVVGALNLVNGRLNAHLELLLSLNSVTNSLAQFFERWRVNKKEVALEGLSVDFLGPLHVHLNDWNFGCVLDSRQLSMSGPVEYAV